MNHVPRHGQPDEELDRIRAVVSRHPMPGFIKSFDVKLGEFSGEPAMWIVFKTDPDRDNSISGMKRQISELNALADSVRYDLIDEFDDRWPYFRFE